MLRTNLGLRGGFIFQFEDLDFNLTDIKDLPVEWATLKKNCPQLMTPQIHWTQAAFLQSVVGIPQFSHNVEVQLREANCRYTRDGSDGDS